jgi:hypothetical protein
MTRLNVQELTPDSTVKCSCLREFLVSELVTLTDTQLLVPNVRHSNPEGHEVTWEPASRRLGYVCGWLNLFHGQGTQAMSGGPRQFVALPIRW